MLDPGRRRTIGGWREAVSVVGRLTVFAILMPADWLAVGPRDPVPAQQMQKPDSPDSRAWRIVLEGRHRCSRGDDRAWKSPAFDDSSWATVAVPGDWPGTSLWSLELGWYRLHFSVPESLRIEQPAVALGHIICADETFLNGVRIGGEGRLGADFVEAPWRQRLYRIPPDVLRYGQENVLAVRGRFPAGGGIVGGPVALGDWAGLEAERLQRERGEVIVQTVFLNFYALALAFCLLLYLHHVRERDYLRFGIVVLCYGLACLFESYAGSALGLAQPWLMRLYVALCLSQPAAVIAFFASVTGRCCDGTVVGLFAAPVLVGCVNLLVPDFWTLGRFLLLLWFVLALATCALVAVWSIRAVRQRLPDAGWLLAAAACGIGGEVVEQVRPFDLIRLGGVYPHHYGIGLFLGCGMLLLVRRFQRAQQRLRIVSASVMQAHAEERSRVARDLHDGVLQTILAANLNLKMLHAAESDAQRRESLAELVRETSGAVEELRRVALSLRPAMLEKIGLVQALQWFADVARSHSGLAIEFQAQLEREPAAETAEQLFRVFQEALSNVQKHAAAHRVLVTLAASGPWLTVQIEDDGRGFDPARTKLEGQGLGLQTIRERVELLGGRVEISSGPGKGTKVCVTVPLAEDG